MTDYRNSCDGSSTVTVTNANSSGPDQFSSVSIGTGCTCTFDTGQVLRGGTAIKLTSPVTAAAVFLRYTPSPAYSAATTWFRAYIYLTANLAVGARIFNWSNAAGSMATVDVDASGHQRSLNASGSTVQTMTGAVPLNAWFRVEGWCLSSATVGQIEVQRFDKTDDVVPTETITSTALQNTRGGAPTNLTFGPGGSGVSSATLWFEDLGISDVAYPGPSFAGVVHRRGPNYRR